MASKSAKSFPLRIGFLLAVILLSVGFFGIWWVEGISPVDKTDKSLVSLTIESGEGPKIIASKLAQEKLIRSPTAFFILIKLMGLERSLQAGDYRLNRSMSADEIAKELTHGIKDVWVTVVEGWRKEEIATKLAAQFDIPESEFLKHAREGYLFPDTYRIPNEATAGAIANMFMNNFDSKVTEQMLKDINESGRSLEEVVIMASLVEREGLTENDRPLIASVLMNRLDEDWPLQVDATLQYALGYQSQEKTWWKKSLYQEDKEIESPYNTYKNKGLPPAPISNPGMDSLRAVIYPARSDYFYYLHDPKGQVHFAKDLEGHNRNIDQYLK